METEPDPAAVEALERAVRADYAAPGRFYHSVDHLDDCLTQLDAVDGLEARERMLLRFAILWHDVVYDPKRSDNEEQSAERARRELAQAGAAAEDCDEVARLILLTKGHRVAADDPLGALLVSIDLSILGAEPERYRAYAADIRREYAHVPEEAYRAGRAAVLRHLLAADPLYPHPAWRARLEGRARANMAAELEALAS